MVKNYEPYCRKDVCFYSRSDEGVAKFIDKIHVPDRWNVHSDYQWTFLFPPDSSRKLSHGWKIHISAQLSDCETVIDLVSRVCFAQEIPFKFCVNAPAYYNLISKYAPRSATGKLITIYPEFSEFDSLCEVLERVLKCTQGPEVLTDLKISPLAPIYTRYGAFTQQRHYVQQENVLGFRSASGEFVTDHRALYFTLPAPEITQAIPDRVHAAYERRENTHISSEQFPYNVVEALHFSNSGGVYKAHHLGNGRTYVLKEARKYVGVEPGSTWDAPARLVHQYRITQVLSVLPEIVPVHDIFEVQGHIFLTTPFVSGQTLGAWILAHSPTSGRAMDDEFESHVYHIMSTLKAVVDNCHALGFAFVDLQPNNILLDEDNNIHIIDLEACVPLDSVYRPTLGTAGFIPPYCDGMTWKYHDYYALLIIVLSMYFPLVSLSSLTCELLAWALEYGKEWMSQRNYAAIIQLYNLFFHRYPQLCAQSYDICPPLALYPSSSSIIECAHALTNTINRVGHVRYMQLAKLATDDTVTSNAQRTQATQATQGTRGTLGASFLDTSLCIYPGAVEGFREYEQWGIYHGIAGVGLSVGRYDGAVKALCRGLIINNFAYMREKISDISYMHGMGGIAALMIENLPDDGASYEHSLCDQIFQDLYTAYQDYFHQPAHMRNISIDKGMSGFALLLLAYAYRYAQIAPPHYRSWAEEILQSIVMSVAVTDRLAQTTIITRPGLLSGYSGVAVVLALAQKILHHDYTAAIQQCLLHEYEHVRSPEQFPESTQLFTLSSGKGGLLLAGALLPPSCIPAIVNEYVYSLEAQIDPLSCLRAGLYEGAAGILLCQKYFHQLTGRFPNNDQELPALLQPHIYTGCYQNILITATDGEGGRRLSLDYGTGSSGVAVALYSIHHDNHDWLPFPYATSLMHHLQA